MDGETNGSQEATQGSENTPQQQGKEQQETQQQGQSQVGGDATDGAVKILAHFPTAP